MKSKGTVRTTKVPRYLLMLLAVLVLWGGVMQSTADAAVISDYISSWFGNTWPGTPFVNGSGSHGVLVVEDLCVTPNGITIGTSAWDEGAKYAPMYSTDGQDIGHLYRLDHQSRYDGGGVTANNDYVWATHEENDGTKGWVARFKVTDYASQYQHGEYCGPSVRVSTDECKGLAIDTDRNELYVSDYAAGKIKVLDASTLAFKREWTAPNPGHLAYSNQGGMTNVWMLQTGVVNPQLYRYDGVGGYQMGSPISFPADVRARDIAVHPSTSKVLIADQGPHSRIMFYNPNSGVVDEYLGADGGVFSGTGADKGRVGPLKLNGPTGVGVDASGNIYVASCGSDPDSSSGAEISSYTSGGSQRWFVAGLAFVDEGAVDPATDGIDIYTKEEHYVMDYTKPIGQEATYYGYTFDAYDFPDDPRAHDWESGQQIGINGSNKVVRINGQKFLAIGSLALYRFDQTNWGEVAIPSVFISRFQHNAPWPVNQPATVPNTDSGWMWRDADGDYQWDANEYESLATAMQSTNGGTWIIDSSGAIWHSGGTDANSQPMRKFPCQGLDSHGNPIYSLATSVTMSYPTSLSKIKRMDYDVANDTMYLAGFSDDYPGANWKGFRVLRAYPNWSSGNRTAQWTIPIAYERNGDENDLAKTFCTAGDYVFWARISEAQEGNAPGTVYVHRKSDGALVGHMSPVSPVYSPGWIDEPYAINAYQRSNGEYVVTLEDDGYEKITMYRWNPGDQLQCATPVLNPSIGTVPQTVTITSATTGATIRYTTDGSVPTASSSIYSSPLNITVACTVKAKAFKAGYLDSAVGMGTYTSGGSTVATPVLSPATGTYNNDQSVTISCGTSGATIYYTTDGSTPTTGSQVYSGAITVNSTAKTIKAMAVKSGMTNSNVASETYTLKCATPSLSPSSGTVPQTVTITCATTGATIRYTTDGSDPTGSSTVYSSPINISAAGTLKARAFKTNYVDGDVASGTYTSGGGGGSIVREYWTGISGTTVASIPTGTAPNGTSTLTSLESPIDWGDSFGERIRGYITAPTTGSYTFWIASDDDSELWLSTNDQPASKVKIAYVNGACDYRNYLKYSSQKSTAITLNAGTQYYVEVLHKDGNGGDNMSVGWAKPGQSTSSPSEVVPGAVLSPYGSGGGTVATPVLSPATGTYNNDQSVTISCGTSGATIYYTTDGSTPTTGSPVYSSAITVNSTAKTIKAMAAKSGMTNSNVASETYTLKCATPSLSPSSGGVPQTVTITCATTGATIRYTNDGSDPTGSSTVYSSPIDISAAGTLKARAFKTNYVDGDVASGTYTSGGGGGSIVREYWTGISGTTVASIPTGTAPNGTSTLTSLESPIDWGDDFGERIRGYITAPATGSYTFWIASDDDSELWLSTDDQPANKVKIAYVNGACDYRNYGKYTSQKSGAITLTAGTRYYVEVLHKDGSGGDNMSVGWAKPGQSTSWPSEVVPGSVLSQY